MPVTQEVSRQIPWDIELDDNDWGPSPELTEREVGRLTCRFCVCCHYYGSSHCISDAFLGRFPHHITANQFFTPEMFSSITGKAMQLVLKLTWRASSKTKRNET